MKNLRKNIKHIIIAALFTGTLVSCEDQGYDDYEESVSPTVALNGEYWIDISDAATGEVYAQHTLHRIFDSGSGDGRMIISDRIPGAPATSMNPIHFYGWMLEGFVNTDPQSLTFNATNELNRADESHFTITNGKILKNAAVSPSGAVTDSIYFEGVFDYDQETKLIFAGHKRTGFQEDEF